MSGRKTLQKENLTTKIPALNISKKKSTAKSLIARNQMKESLTINNQAQKFCGEMSPNKKFQVEKSHGGECDVNKSVEKTDTDSPTATT